MGCHESALYGPQVWALWPSSQTITSQLPLKGQYMWLVRRVVSLGFSKNNDCQSITRRRNARSKTSDNGRDSSSLPIPIYLIIDIFSRLPLNH
ncbi:hypothetical protein DY000_02010795 [Brassica cretica]|uniref:Uncharacterized protein n=1 Tax=Brassica cretica TaxID=69181 RepID=A0ABQ7CS89_BRACR|nr:hypothetical protein DY000_02010795 [Brassica cretica]